jgi:hypothetical protein
MIVETKHPQKHKTTPTSDNQKPKKEINSMFWLDEQHMLLVSSIY